MSGYRLGIDIGTTYTAAATHDADGTRMLSLGADKPEIPSVVALDDRARTHQVMPVAVAAPEPLSNKL